MTWGVSMPCLDDHHRACIGKCECQCHQLPMPADFRARVEAARAKEDQ